MIRSKKWAGHANPDHHPIKTLGFSRWELSGKQLWYVWSILKKLLRMHLSHFQNESYIPQLFTRKFSPREPKCLNGVAVGDSDGQFIFLNESYIY